MRSLWGPFGFIWPNGLKSITSEPNLLKKKKGFVFWGYVLGMTFPAQLYGDYLKLLQGDLLNNQDDSWKVRRFFFVALCCKTVFQRSVVTVDGFLVGGWTNPFEKIWVISQNGWKSSPRIRGENKKSLSCHHLDTLNSLYWGVYSTHPTFNRKSIFHGYDIFDVLRP